MYSIIYIRSLILKKNPLILIVVFFLFLSLVLLTSFLIYREWSPSDQQAATGKTYYLSPSGNDNTGNGSSANPWRTVVKAQNSINSGDTVILKNGTYPGYITLSKANTTWKAENKHQAVFDGGFAPSLLNGSWNNIVTAWNSNCEAKGHGAFKNLISVSANAINVDGLFLRNSCGRGVYVSPSASNFKLENTRIDWTFTTSIWVDPATNNVQLLNNILTRNTFNDQYKVYNGEGYGVAISIMMSGKDMVVSGNIIAWGRGEIAMSGARNILFENNTVVGNKNNFYPGPTNGLTVRNNLFFNPESEFNQGTHWDRPGGARRAWIIVGRSESGITARYSDYANTLNNYKFYNNLVINNSFELDGYHRGGGQFFYSNNITKVYVGQNTFISGSDTSSLFRITAGPVADGQNSIVTGIFESNIFDTRKNPSTIIRSNHDSNDNITFRNNIWPTNVSQSVKGPGDIYTNDPGLANATRLLDIKPPAIGASNIDLVKLRGSVSIKDYYLRNNSQAINKASTAGNASGTTIPTMARAVDYHLSNRVGIPDIGAFEFGGVANVNTPTPLNTVAPTSLSPGFPTTIYQTAACGQADVKGDGQFGIDDFAEFARAYGNGKNTCAMGTENYGPCGGRDVNNDGILNIFDFGSPVIGFAQRYGPHKACNLP
mgnify:CR=1 FL=1